MREHGQRGRAPAVIGDVSEDDSDVYMIGIREADAPDSWSLLFMEPYDAEDPQEIQLSRSSTTISKGPGSAGPKIRRIGKRPDQQVLRARRGGTSAARRPWAWLPTDHPLQRDPGWAPWRPSCRPYRQG